MRSELDCISGMHGNVADGKKPYQKIRIFANFGVIHELITYSDFYIGIETKRK
jgi:hypothetical protein